MAVSAIGVTPAGSLAAFHRVFTDDIVAGYDDPQFDHVGDGSAEVAAASWSNYTDRGVLKLASGNDLPTAAARMYWPLRTRETGTTGDVSVRTDDRSWTIMAECSYTLDTSGGGSITNRWNAASDRAALLQLSGSTAATESLNVRFVGGGDSSTTYIQVTEDNGSNSITGNVNVNSLLGTRLFMVIDVTFESSAGASDGKVDIWFYDASGTTGLARQRRFTAAEVRSAGTKVFETSAYGAPRAVGGIRLLNDAAGFTFSGSAQMLLEYGAIGLFDSNQDAVIDLDEALGSLVSYSEVTSTTYRQSVYAQCPPGAFDTTATEVWAQIESFDGIIWGSNGDAKQFTAATRWSGTVQSGTLTKTTNTKLRLKFYDGDPAGVGSLIGTGPDLTPRHAPTIAHGTCATLAARPWTALTDAVSQGCSAFSFAEDFTYPTGSNSGNRVAAGTPRCTQTADFYDSYAIAFRDVAVRDALRSMSLQLAQPGDHPSGKDFIGNADFSDTTTDVQRWDSSTLKMNVVVGNARTVWHDLFTSTQPNVQAFNATAASSGYDWYWLIDGHMIYNFESVKHRGLVSDSLLSNSTTSYPGTSLDQESAFGTAVAAAASADKVVAITTVRVAGPNELTFSDNWRDESAQSGSGSTIAGFARIVARYNSNAPVGAQGLVALTGDRHLTEGNTDRNGLLFELTSGPIAANHWGESPLDHDNGFDTFVSAVQSGVVPGSGDVAMAYAVVELGLSSIPVTVRGIDASHNASTIATGLGFDGPTRYRDIDPDLSRSRFRRLG